MSASSSVEEVQERWSLSTRIAFRFFFCFFLIYLPIPLMFNFARLMLTSIAFWSTIVPRVAQSMFGISVRAEQNGSGDTTWNWVQLFVMVAVSVALTIVWSILDRKRLAYPRLHVFLRVYLRFSLAIAMFMYAVAKVIPMQFQQPSLDRLTQRVGDASPMGLLWTFMGASAAYTIFAGLGELIGGFLLTMRRTALLGALITAAVMTNVVMLNFSYDVPVKIYSSVLLLTALFIATPDARRLLHVFVLNRPADAARLEPSVRWPWLQNVLRIARTAMVLWFVVMSLQRTRFMRRTYVQPDARIAVHGIWSVDELAIDGVPRPPLLTDATRWQRIIFTGNRGASIDLVNQQRQRYTVMHDPTGFILRKRDDPLWQASFFTEQPDTSTLRLTGSMDGRKIAATLHKTPTPEFLLQSRGFHWINEVPYNR